MAGASDEVPARCSDACPKACNDRADAHAGSVASSRAERVRLRDQDFPHERDRIVRTMCVRSRAHMCGTIRAPSGHDDATLRRPTQRHRQPWRERPLRTRAGPFPARAPGSLTPWFPALIAAPAPAQWAAKNAAHRAACRALTVELAARESVIGGAGGGPSLASLMPGGICSDGLGGTTSISEVVPQVVLCC